MKQLITLTAFIITFAFSFSQTKEQDSLAIELAFQNQDSTKVNTAIKLIKSLYNAEEYQKALQYIHQSERLSSSLQYNKGTAEIKYYKALIYSQRDDYFNALDNYNKSLNLFRQLSDSLGIAKVNNSLGLVEIKRGNYGKGLRHSLSAIGIFESKNLRNELSSAYNNLAEAYYNTNQIDKSLEFNTKALQVREQLQDSVGIKLSTKNIAELYALRNEHRKSIEFYEKALALLNPEIDVELRGDILPNLGEQYLQFKEFENATPYLLEGLQYNRDVDNKSGIFKSLNNIANLNYQQGNLRTAEFQLNEAFQLTNVVNDDRELLKHYFLRKAIDSTRGYFGSALNWQRQYYTLKEKITRENATPILIEDIVEPEVITKTPTKIDEEGNLVVDTKAMNKLKWISYILGALLAILLISFIIISVNRNSKNKAIKILEAKNKQFKLQIDDSVEQTHQLEEMNHVKDRLFSIVSHDLKDSITSIKAFLDLLKEDSISEDEFNELIPELSDNADNASALLLNLLNWSKSQMQNLEPKPSSFNIQEVFQEKMQLVDKKVQKKRIVLLDESVKDAVYADRSMVEIVIQNLLANAVKFSRIGDVITISNRERNGDILICIEDTGVGISKENQEKIFGTGGYTTRGTNDEKGTGLGLSICKQLVELNKGKIWVESDIGLGSKFYVELPRSKPESS
jgi:signal transduction histidine kinase/tetratricopeptide (TPR) repeat protein